VRNAFLYLVLAACCGCGYVGSPLPPAMNIPQPVTGLTATQLGDKVVVDFIPPVETTEGLKVKRAAALDLRIGRQVNPFDANAWASGAKKFDMPSINPKDDEETIQHVHTELPVADFVGQDVLVAVRSANPKGRPSGWSNFVALHIAAPPPVPLNLKAVSDPKGLRLGWDGSSPAYRVLRKLPGDNEAAQLGEPTGNTFLDETAEVDKKYQYSVIAVDGGARSKPSEFSEFILRDIFPPAAPAGVTAIIGASSVELAWESNSEPDLKSYRIYRSIAGAAPEIVGEVGVPAYSDKKLQAGRKHSYTITAVDKHNNESAKSAAVDVEIP
jgi:hypothetical protein